MSMFILNSKLNERYPTVIDGLMYTYPFDGEKHCCINNLRYAKILRINGGSDELYRYFYSKGSLITDIALDIETEDFQFNEGQYNLVIIDCKDLEITQAKIKQIKEKSNDAKTSVIIHSMNETNTGYNYGGSYIHISNKVKEKVMLDAITRGSLYKSTYNMEVLDDCIILKNGFFSIPWDNRLDEFSITLDLEIDYYKDIVNIACITNDSTLLLDISYNVVNHMFTVKTGTSSASYDMSKSTPLDSVDKITITKYDNKIQIFKNDKLYTSAKIDGSTKGNNLIIGKNSFSQGDNSSIIRVSNLSLYDKKLNLNEIDILNNGRLIFT